MERKREHFGGRMAVIATMAGSAIGLGNIWRFPYLVGKNGGAAFILIYIGFVIVMSIPIFMAEAAIGRHCGTDCQKAVGSMVSGKPGKWLGFLLVLAPLWVLSYYIVVGGWSLEYLYQALSLRFSHVQADAVSGSFEQFITRPWAPVLCELLFMGCTVGIVLGGVKKGIEKFSEWCIPTLFILIVLFDIYCLFLPGAAAGARFMWKPDFSQVTLHTFIDALGQSFFSLSLGMGIIMTYSSYISKKENLMVAAVGTSLCDIVFACLAAFAILPAVFAAGIEPGSGPGLVFDTLPYIFCSMGQAAPVLSAVAAILFFLSVFFAALTSSVSLLEVGVSYLTESHGMKRSGACVLLFVICGAFGLLCSLSFSSLSGVQILGKNIFDFADSFASNVLLVLGGLLVVILAGWVMSKKELFGELTNRGTLKTNVKLFPFIRFMMRYVAPAGIGLLVLTMVI